MITREEIRRRLEDIAQELMALRQALDEEEADDPSADPTEAFLTKCGGWEDTRSPETIISDIYASRTISDHGRIDFTETSS